MSIPEEELTKKESRSLKLAFVIVFVIISLIFIFLFQKYLDPIFSNFSNFSNPNPLNSWVYTSPWGLVLSTLITAIFFAIAIGYELEIQKLKIVGAITMLAGLLLVLYGLTAFATSDIEEMNGGRFLSFKEILYKAGPSKGYAIYYGVSILFTGFFQLIIPFNKIKAIFR
jgi:hypothetical protein